MKSKSLLAFIPMISLLSGCSVAPISPFKGDVYTPVGYATEAIVRGFNDEETNLLAASYPSSDQYLTRQFITNEARDYSRTYFGAYAPHGGAASDTSYSESFKLACYTNDVKVVELVAASHRMYDYADVTSSDEQTDWTFLPTTTTYETRRAASTDGSEDVVSTIAEGAYDPSSHPTLFGLATSAFFSGMSPDYYGVSATDELIYLDFASTREVYALSRDSACLLLTSMVREAHFTLYEPEDESPSFYYLAQYREFADCRIISEIYQVGQNIVYLDETVSIGYLETTSSWDVASNGVYDIGSIPDVTISA